MIGMDQDLDVTIPHQSPEYLAKPWRDRRLPKLIVQLRQHGLPLAPDAVGGRFGIADQLPEPIEAGDLAPEIHPARVEAEDRPPARAEERLLAEVEVEVLGQDLAQTT